MDTSRSSWTNEDPDWQDAAALLDRAVAADAAAAKAAAAAAASAEEIIKVRDEIYGLVGGLEPTTGTSFVVPLVPKPVRKIFFQSLIFVKRSNHRLLVVSKLRFAHGRPYWGSFRFTSILAIYLTSQRICRLQ